MSVYAAASQLMIDFLRRHPEVQRAEDFTCPYMRALYVALDFPQHSERWGEAPNPLKSQD